MSLLLAAWLATAHAHDLRPGAIAIHERESGQFSVRTTPPQDGGVAVQMRPVWPAGCAMENTTLRCADGLSGTLHLGGLAEREVRVLVRVTWIDGTAQQVLLHPGEDHLSLGREASETGGFPVGLAHALRRWDHVLFVAGLAAICRSAASQIVAVATFALGHLLALGVAISILVVHPSATELVFALSLLLLGREAVLDTPPTLTRRFPWTLALLAGLLHGLGAGDRTPRDAAAAGLGMGTGLFVTLAGCAAVSWLWRLAPQGIRPHGRKIVAYAVGIPGGVWSIQHAVSWLRGP